MNNDIKVLWHDETCDASRVRERDENSKRMLRKSNHKIKRNKKKAEFDNWENEEHDWKKYLSKDDD